MHEYEQVKTSKCGQAMNTQQQQLNIPNCNLSVTPSGAPETHSLFRAWHHPLHLVWYVPERHTTESHSWSADA